MLTLMYITNDPDTALIVQQAGVDRIFLDMECIGKAERQCGMDTVVSAHTIEDIRRVRSVITRSGLLVRCNPVYKDTRREIDDIVGAGADIIMLPYFKTVEEVRLFIEYVNGRAKTCLLFETPEAVRLADEILAVDGIDEVHIGINDLSIGYHKKFLFEVLADGTVDCLCDKFRAAGITYGFGGIASLGHGLLSSEYVIMEHCRLGSSMAILSRSFCNTEITCDIDAINSVFMSGVKAIRDYERYCLEHPEKWEHNREETARRINLIAAGM